MLRDCIDDDNDGKSVGCRCLAGRPHRVLVVPDRCGVVLVLPPDSTAVLSNSQVRRLRMALTAAAAVTQAAYP